MSIWAQVLDDRTTALPPDGKTLVDVYAQFSFSEVPLPEGVQIHFAVGSGSASSAGSPSDFVAAIVPIDGITLMSPIGVVENQIVRNADGTVSVLPVASVTLNPISSSFNGSVTVAAYSTYDKLGTTTRFSTQEIQLVAATGSGAFSGTMERYDPVGDVWDTKTSMNVGRSGLFAELVSGKIYAIGGFAQEFVGNVEEYDPASDTWTDKSPMPTVRGFGCSTTYNDEIYVIGGYNFDPNRARSELEKYTPLTDTWTALAPMPIPLAFHSCVLIGANIYVFYGSSKIDEKEVPSQFNSGVLRYDILADDWHYVKSIYASPTTCLTTAAALVGSTFIKVSNASLPQTGFVTITDIDTLQEETLAYGVFSNSTLLLITPTTIAFGAGSSVVKTSTNNTRLSACTYASGNVVHIFDGFDGTNYLSSIETFNISTFASTVLVGNTSLARSKAATAIVGGDQYIIGGSAEKSDFLADTESVGISSGIFTGGLSKPDVFRTGAVAASDDTYVYLMGGQESGHDPGWVNLSCTANPASVLADGRSSSAITVTATDAGGDPPPTVRIRLKGLIYLTPPPATTVSTTSTAAAAATAAAARSAPPTISILPVLFSSQEFDMVNGAGSTTLLPRSEDQINEVSALTEFIKGNEVLLAQQQLLQQAATLQSTTQQFGDRRTLYNVAIEATLLDDTYFGTSNSALVVGVGVAPTTGSFFNPATLQEGLSASVEFYSDIVSIPNVEILTNDPVDGASAKTILDGLRKIVPFGTSPHYDAIVAGANEHIGENPATQVSMMISTCDNENSGSSATSDDVISDVNSVFGPGELPVFITTFVITNPISLSARKARTDVAELEDISTQTSGNSFSVLDASYTGFVIDRIKTSAPASIGAGTISIPHDLDGSIYSISYSVDNLIDGNSASIIVEYSLDGYEFLALDADIPPNVEYVLSTPIQAESFKYSVTLQSSSFDSPILTSVTVKYVKPNVQYLLTNPRLISGQVTELAAVTNQRLPDGCKVSVGLVHGDSIMFDRDYVTDGQPSISDRGTIIAINRDSDAVVDQIPFKESLSTSNFVSYSAESGPWALDAIIRVFINGQEVPDNSYFATADKGTIVFKKRLSSSDVVEMYVQNPESFRIGLKIENPTLQEGKLDSFAFMWGTTSGTGSDRPLLPPTVSNLFVSPSPAFPGGPLTANYAYRDPNGNPEDKSQTLIVWFRNGIPIPELNNKTAIANSDIIAKRADSAADSSIARGQQWSFSVRPSNGFLFGLSATSGSITISNNPPVASNIRFTSSNSNPQVFTSSDIVQVNHDYFDLDGDLTGGDIIEWFVNSVSFKSGSVDTLSPNEVDKNGLKALKPGNTISVQITPFDGFDYGATIQSSDLLITPTPPTVTDASILPTLPSVASTLRLTYTFVDVDGNTDQSLIAWFVDGQRNPELDNSKVVAPSFLNQRQKWSAVVTPSDGQVQGELVTSNTVVVQF